MPSKDIIQDVRKNCPCEHLNYCPLEELVKNQSARLYEQHKCVEILKYKEGQKVGYDIGWQQAYFIWVEQDFAKYFAEVYKDDMKHEEIYTAILQLSEQNKNSLTDQDILT